MRKIVYVGAFAAAVLLAAIAPGRTAEATDCAPPEPRHLFLELESVSINGFVIVDPDEVWAHLEPQYYWRENTVDSLRIDIEGPWKDEWSLGGQEYARAED